MQSVSLKHRLAGKRSLKKTWMQKESVSKQGRKSAKGEPSVHKDSLFDEIPEDTLDYMETEDAQDVGRSRDVVNEEKENVDAEVSTEDVLSTAKEKVSTDAPKVSTDESKVSTTKKKVSSDTPMEEEKIEKEDELKTNMRVIHEAKRSLSKLASDEEMARKVQEDWGKRKEERKRLAEEEATNDALIRNYEI
ncbi:hypothetical protein Tco_0351374 [Tanacetum coccineum]